MTQHNILDVRGLSVSFRMYGKGLRRIDTRVVSHMSLTVRTGEILAIIGSSGSGKSLLAHAILGILPENAAVTGDMLFDGTPLTPDRQAALRGREIALVPQSVAFLDPLQKVGAQMRGVYGTRAEQERIFAAFGLPPETAEMYPFQISGGMARRILVGTALMSRARLVIADEPTPGLSLDIAEKTMRRFRGMAEEGRGVLLITHDIDLAAAFADRIAVFYGGEVLEIADAAAFRAGGAALQHPYSRALWAALPQNEFTAADWQAAPAEEATP